MNSKSKHPISPLCLVHSSDLCHVAWGWQARRDTGKQCWGALTLLPDSWTIWGQPPRGAGHLRGSPRPKPENQRQTRSSAVADPPAWAPPDILTGPPPHLQGLCELGELALSTPWLQSQTPQMEELRQLHPAGSHVPAPSAKSLKEALAESAEKHICFLHKKEE